MGVALGGADVGELPLEVCVFEMRGLDMGGNKSREKRCKHTLLKWLQALKCDLKKVLVGELGGVVGHIDAEKRDDRHFEFVFKIR